MSCVTATSQCLTAITRGHVQLILGPMFSGKTTELIRRMRRFQVANYACLIVKYAKDDRYSNQDVSTHDKQMTAGISATELTEVKKKAKKYGVIGIDEGQFFPDIVDFCEEMANAGKTVIVAALDGTFQRKPFGPILNLVPMAESVVKLKAVCMVCYKDAAFTKRLGAEKQIEVIGGSDKYMAVCRTCFSLPDKPTLTSKEVTPIRGGDLTLSRQLFTEDP
uniref:Thymidine kinase n=1 Tax=Suberites domuncula TaxID=55567 RepID=B6YPU7_SUBDO|nr:thymidine kinase [Suberites domuncula]